MKRTLYFSTLIIAFCLSKFSFAQVENIPYYNNIQFNNSFTVIAEKNDQSNFYAVNLSELKSDFEKAYFQEIAFQETKIIRIDANNNTVAWFKADKTYSEAEINALFLSLKSKTITETNNLTKSEQQNWLQKTGK